MEHVFKDLKTPHAWAWGALILCLIFVVFLFANPALESVVRGWLALAAYGSLCLFFWPSLLKAAHEDHRHLLTVCIWSFVVVILGIAVSFYAFFAIAGDEYQKFDKLLNVVPVFVAIWAAAVGWLIHFKLTTKAHRTNNAFAIIMETRKSSEFLARSALASKHFPPGMKSMPEGYDHLFSSIAIQQVLANSNATAAEKEKAEAVQALKYVLNYYEFMAVGIRAGDLDETLVYDTIHPTVCAIVERSRRIIDYLSNGDNPGGHSTTYCELKALAARWKQRRAAAEAGAAAN